jgi:hypothetical protein
MNRLASQERKARAKAPRRYEGDRRDPRYWERLAESDRCKGYEQIVKRSLPASKGALTRTPPPSRAWVSFFAFWLVFQFGLSFTSFKSGRDGLVFQILDWQRGILPCLSSTKGDCHSESP